MAETGGEKFAREELVGRWEDDDEGVGDVVSEEVEEACSHGKRRHEENTDIVEFGVDKVRALLRTRKVEVGRVLQSE